MTRLVHLSDLHFGFDRTALIEPLLDRVNRAGADLVVVTGDLTHRARSAQFAQAAAFLRRIEVPLIAVPGNHDIPLYKLADRMMKPYRRYRRIIAQNMEPVGHVGQVRVQGINSVDPMAWQRGVISAAQMRRVVEGIDPDCVNIVALHHPMQQRPEVDKQLMRGAREAMALFELQGVQVVLSGHLHIWSAGAFLPPEGRSVLQIQGGTALCARLDDRQNEFAVLDFQGPDLLIERHVAPMDEPGFRPPEHLRFTRRDRRWHRT
ncbi:MULTISPECIES: metallophosphoesterase family protein [Paracoccus]|uniref:Metallophosphoesterase n=2 Tax=Paracoccus TaxID=265 RepID=A0A386UIT0_9RHOB|nr:MULTISPECIES: metallophosphoesterase [Paracoccus]AWX92956.1 metallophosphoesterase [Paracoccus mutanolyticus]AYF00179.1 metallophosphoesterase [Paracoccus yeei]OWJ88943.1 metallophosphoesterase [Paracoccus yeei]